MKIIQKAIKDLPGLEYYIKHLNIINPFLPVKLTPKEIEVLGTFMSFDLNELEIDRFNSHFRKEVMRLLKISNGGLGNHLSQLRLKKAIEGTDNGLRIKDFLFPEESIQLYQFKINKKGDVNTP